MEYYALKKGKASEEVIEIKAELSSLEDSELVQMKEVLCLKLNGSEYDPIARRVSQRKVRLVIQQELPVREVFFYKFLNQVIQLDQRH